MIDSKSATHRGPHRSQAQGRSCSQKRVLRGYTSA